MAHILAAGTTAPNFTLRETPDQNLSLSELKGKPVILAFYPADWSPVCGDQLALYNEVLPEFRKQARVFSPRSNCEFE
jgi:peroxiredoxin